MTFDDGAYASDVLRVCGAYNVFSGRARRYPLAADLGRPGASSRSPSADRDTRYPRVRLEEAVERGARAVLLPDEPYSFGEADAVDIGALPSPAPIVVEHVDGKDLVWYGTHLASAVEGLGAKVADARARSIGLAPNN